MAKIKKIIYLLEYPYCKRDHDRFGVETLKGSGFDVEVWDVSKMLHHKAIQKVEVPDAAASDSYRLFSDFADLKVAMLGLDDSCFVICFVHYKLISYKIYRLMSRMRLNYCVHGTSYPMVSLATMKNNAWVLAKVMCKNFVAKLRDIKFSFIVNRVFLCIPFKILGIRAASIGLGSGDRTYFSFFPMDTSTEILWAHYFDYDIYLQEVGRQSSPGKKTAVFLDSYLPFHPEFIYLKISHPIKPEDYYPQLRRFFEYIEQKLGMNVIIAAHPRSNYRESNDCFGQRPVVRGRTAELVREASLVLAHQSFSLGYAILFNKPVIFLTSDTFDNKGQMFTEINMFAELFGKRAIYMNRTPHLGLDEELTVNDEKYRHYKHCYIKRNGTPELPFWQVVADRLKTYDCEYKKERMK